MRCLLLVLVGLGLIFTSPLHPSALQEVSDAICNVAENAIPAVVFIKGNSVPESGVQAPAQPGSPFGNDLFFRFFGLPQAPPPPVSYQVGSGFFVSPDGYIMTNAHVVSGTEKIEVTLEDGQLLPATLVGSDPSTDIAIIKIEGKNFPFLTFGDSDKARIGQFVLTIGSPWNLMSSVSFGVVSATRRQTLGLSQYEDFIQTDAAVNPGNSGGPLLSALDGKVMGVNTAIVSPPSQFQTVGGNVGISFAVPSNIASLIMKSLIEHGSVVHGFMGITMQPVDHDIAIGFNLDKAEGALISDVRKNSPADQAGLKQGDIILACNDKPIKSSSNFRNEVGLMAPGTIIQLKIHRKGKILIIPVTLGSAPENPLTPGTLSKKLGLEVEALTPDLAQQLGYPREKEGVVITKVKPGSLAAFAGLRPGFLILEVNHKVISTPSDYTKALEEVGKKGKILLLIQQGQQGTGQKYYLLRTE